MSKLLFIQDIDLDGSPMVRSHIRDEVVAEYADLYRKCKVKLPPVDVFTPDGKHFLLADGAHRTAALVSLKSKTIECKIHDGGPEEALRFALIANEKHGIRRSNADKRRAIAAAVKQWPKCSDSQIAAICVVDKHTVTDVREELENAGKVKPEPVRIAKDGKERAAAKSDKKPSEKSPVDGVGTAIPEFALTFWNRREEVAELMATLKLVSKFLVETQKKEDLMYGEINFSAALGDLDKVLSNVSTAMPYAVCTTCQGQPKTQPKGECRMCKGRGVISRFRWNSLVPAEIKKMKEKKS